MADFDVDLFDIGAGSGGVRAARIASGHGARVMIAEEYRVGGTCVIRGCVPKKLLVYASRFADEFEDAAGYGWTLGEPSFDWRTLIANKDREIARLELAYTTNLERSKVEIVKSRAEIEDAHGGAVEIIDFAPRYRRSGRMFRPLAFIRLIRPVAGTPRIRVRSPRSGRRTIER